MKTWSLPASPQALIFDLDSTLYTNSAYARFQTSALVERLAAERGERVEATTAILDGLKAKRRASGAGDDSLANLSLALGISIETSVQWRYDLIRPADWLASDWRLDYSLSLLGRRYRLALVTNNPHGVGIASLEALGVSSRFESITGLDDSLHSKPHRASFLLSLDGLRLPAETCVSIGDRFDVDLEPALALGMGAILVSGVEEVYELPAFFGVAT